MKNGQRERGTTAFAADNKYRGGLSLNSNKANAVVYYTKEFIKTARKQYTCPCCNSIIKKDDLYVRRIKDYYLDIPRFFEEIRLCKNCALKT